MDEMIINRIFTHMNEYKEASASKLLPNTYRSLSNLKWQKPRTDIIKINVDGALKVHTGISGIGAIARNSDGVAIACFAKRIYHHTDILQIECLAVDNALRWAKEMDFKEIEIEIETDSLLTSNFVKNGNEYSNVRRIVQNIRNEASTFERFSINFCSRSCNKAAHSLAQYATGIAYYEAWISQSPEWLQKTLYDDV